MEGGSSYMDILINRSLYMSYQDGLDSNPGPSVLKVSALLIKQLFMLIILLMKKTYVSIIS